MPKGAILVVEDEPKITELLRMYLELGADDYITKPFSPREVVARVLVVLRRAAPEPTRSVLRSGALELDAERHEARRDGAPLDLTPTEFRLLVLLPFTKFAHALYHPLAFGIFRFRAARQGAPVAGLSPAE